MAKDLRLTRRKKTVLDLCVRIIHDNLEMIDVTEVVEPDGSKRPPQAGDMPSRQELAELLEDIEQAQTYLIIPIESDFSVQDLRDAVAGNQGADGMTAPRKCERCGEVYDEARGDGYNGMCPSCADETEPEDEDDEDEPDGQEIPASAP